jgi:hypothetical protein
MYLRRLRTMMDTYVKAPGTSPLLLPMEKHILELQELMREEANRDRAKWNWPAKGGQCNWDPGITFDKGVQDMIDLFVGMRRYHFYVRHSVANTGFPIGSLENQNAGIPLSQPDNPMLRVANLDYNPSSSNQNQEFICLTNPNPYAVDISGWKLDGAVEFTFALGTVIPSNKVLYVSPDVNAFRARTTGPRGGQGLFVVGNYQGQLSARGESIEIFDAKGRGVSTNTYPGNPSLVQQYLRVTELMYNPSPLLGNTNDPQNFEFIELKNIGPVALNLLGTRFVNGVTFTFTTATPTNLGPGQTVLLVKNQAAFTARYGTVANIGGQFDGYLNNGGERLRLLAADGEEILDFEYDNSWYPITDGLGFSLVVVDETAEPDLWNSKSNWRPSGQIQGTPGGADPGAATFAPIVVNEVLTHTDLPQVDAVELYNPTANDVNIGGWFISDDFTNVLKFRIPNGTVIQALDYLVFDQGDFTTFAFSSKGDEVFLCSGDPAGSQLTGYIDGFDFGAAENGVSFGRHTNSVGDVDIVALAQLTLNGPNSGPKVGPVVISEIMYHPPDVNGEDNSGDEFIELQNISANTVPLFDPSTPTNTWRLTSAVDYAFPRNVTLAAGARLLVVAFDPVDDEAALAAFRALYGVPENIPIYGPFTGKLDNSDETIELLKPDAPELTEVPWIRVERIHYRDDVPWPPGADGIGPSLQRLAPTAYGNDPASWVAAAPTPGTGLGVGEPPVITTQPADSDLVATFDGQLSVSATGTAPLRYQWQFNGDNIPDGTGSTLNLVDVLPENAGEYSVLVYNTAGCVLSSNALVQVLIPASIVLQPQPLSVRLGSNAVFSVQTASTSPVSFQWRFNGVPLVGQTSATLTIVNVQAENDGLYDVIVTDEVASIVSDSARLKVVINPSVVKLATQYSVVQGGSVTLSVESAGTLPMGYRWRKNFSTFQNQVLNSHISFLTLSNVQPADGGSTRYSVVLTNEAMPTPGILSSNVYLTVLADADTDGLPDSWESANNVQDPNLDKDGDGLTNGEEYLAGTDPSDPKSYLRVERISVSGDVRIEFNALSNKTYSIQFKNSLEELIWNKLTEVVASPTNCTVILTDPTTAANRYYRLVTPQQP